MERLTDDRFLKNGFYQPKSKDEEKEIRSIANDLTFEKLYRHCAEVEKENAELQKQVDELKNDLRKSVELIKEGGELAKINNEIIAQVYEQAVKDTAKEILHELLKWLNQSISFSNGKSLNGSVQYGAMNKAYHEVNRRVKKIAESKGVEVE